MVFSECKLHGSVTAVRLLAIQYRGHRTSRARNSHYGHCNHHTRVRAADDVSTLPLFSDAAEVPCGPPSGAQGPASQCDSRRLVSRKFAGSSRLTRLQSTISPSLRHLTCVAKSLIFLIRKRMDFWRTT